MKLNAYGHITRTTLTAYGITSCICKPCLMIAMNTFKYYQPNPVGNVTRDCVIRAISAALDLSWDEDALLKMCTYFRESLLLCDAERQNIVRTLLSCDPAEDNVGVAAVDAGR